MNYVLRACQTYGIILAAFFIFVLRQHPQMICLPFFDSIRAFATLFCPYRLSVSCIGNTAKHLIKWRRRHSLGGETDVYFTWVLPYSAIMCDVCLLAFFGVPRALAKPRPSENIHVATSRGCIFPFCFGI